MRPWTTRTVQAAVVAAGFAAVGAGTASAAETTDVPEPDLSSIPDQIGFTAPVNACQMQEGAGFGPVKAPCADAQLHASSPNLVKQVGVDITTTAHGVAGELQDGSSPLVPGKANRVLGHLVAEGDRLAGMTKTRPTLGVSATPEHIGVLHERVPDATLLDAEIGPYTPGHQGVSAVDTAFDVTAVQGFESQPVISPVGAISPVAELDQGLGGDATRLSDQITSRVSAKPVHRISGVLDPVVEEVVGTT
ncbi:hypothetical protein GCM10023108_46800 [Saccharopolyspora hordei]